MSNARNGATKLVRLISVTDYGARGDGVTDDRTAVAAALTAAVGLAPCTLTFPRGTYKINSALGAFNLSGVTLDLDGSVLDFSSVATGSATYLEIAGTYSGTPISLTSNAAAEQKTVSLTSTGLSAGQMVRIYSDSIYDSTRTSSKFGELNFIETVPGGTSVTVINDLAGTYNTAAAAKLQVVTPVANFVLRNGRIVGPGANDSHIGIKVVLGYNVLIDNIRSDDVDSVHMQIVDSTFVKVMNCHFEESNSASLGYGVSFLDASQDCAAIGNTFTDVRHSLSTNNSAYGITRRILFSGNVVTDSAKATGGSGGDAIDTHAASEDITIIGNVVNASSGSGINVEGRNAVIKNNTVTNSQANGITYQNYTDLFGEVAIIGNTIRDVFGSYGIAVVPNATRIVNATITGNDIRANTTGIRAVGSSGKVFDNITISGNAVLNEGANNGIQLHFADSGAVTGNTVTTLAVGVELDTVTNIAVTGNGVELTAASGVTGFGVRIQGTSEGCSVTGNAMRHTGALSAAAAVSFLNTTVTYSGCWSNVGRGFTAGTVFNVGTGTGNAAANNIT